MARQHKNPYQVNTFTLLVIATDSIIKANKKGGKTNVETIAVIYGCSFGGCFKYFLVCRMFRQRVNYWRTRISRIPKANEAFAQKFPDKEYNFTLLPPMKSITKQRNANMESALKQPIAISSNCKYTDVAIKLLDFFFTKEGTLLASFGVASSKETKGAEVFEIIEKNQVPSEYVEGIENENAVFVKAIVDDPTQKLLNYGYFELQTPHMSGRIFSSPVIDISQPPLLDDDRMKTILTIKEMGLDKLDPTKGSLNAADFTFVKFTSVQNKRAAELTGPIDSLVEQYKAKFVVGSESLDKWDGYIAQLKQLGIDELLSIYNEGYMQYMGQ